jgi:hypothetical protein
MVKQGKEGILRLPGLRVVARSMSDGLVTMFCVRRIRHLGTLCDGLVTVFLEDRHTIYRVILRAYGKM